MLIAIAKYSRTLFLVLLRVLCALVVKKPVCLGKHAYHAAGHIT